MKQFTYTTSGTCSKAITFEVDDNGLLHNVHFNGGCAGNTAGISLLVEGQSADEVCRRLSGVRCGLRPTSCPDQLAQAIKSNYKF